MTPAGGWCVRDGVFDVRQNVRHFIGGISVRSHRLAPLVSGDSCHMDSEVILDLG